MKYCYFKTRNRRGFTLVELMVVLAVTAILAVLVGGGLIAYTRLARFQKNESNARAMFQTAQLAAAQMELAGEKDDFTALVAAGGHGGHITQTLTDTMSEDERNALNARVYALYFDKGAEPEENTPEGKLYAYIKQYVHDSSFLDAAFCIEIDASTGQVFSVFYDSGAQALRFENNKDDTTDATLLDDRSYQNRRDQTLVGYYCADDAVNVVNLQQSKLRVRNQRLINGETLDVTWGGTSKSNETDTQYTVEIYSKTGTGDKKLFSVLVTLPAVNETQMSLPVTLYDEHGSETTENYNFPLRYTNGSFVLTLDAMNDAAILQAHSDPENGEGIDKTEFFSITRFVKDATDIYAKITAAPSAKSVTSYIVSEGADTNTENSLYAKGGTPAELQCFRHLYNLRWYTGSDPLTATLTKEIDWLSGAPVVYCAQNGSTSAVAKTPAADAPVAWPSLLELKKNVTLDGGSHTITGLQLRGNSVAKDGCRYIGLVAENSGTIKNLTLADPDVLVNLTAETTGTTYTVGGETLALMDTGAEGYRTSVRAVGALCGVSTGTVENCTVKRSKNRTATARVAASLTFNDTTTTYTRTDTDGDGKIDKEPLGIGGLVGSAVPGKDHTLKTLTVEKNVTVAGIWQDGGTKTATDAAANETTERNRIVEATNIDRAIGVGGVFGVLSLQEEPCKVEALYNAAEVCGNAYTGGVAGNLRGKSGTKPAVTDLSNTGSVLALAGYNGYTQGESRVLGQFFGGVAGMMKNATLKDSYSSTRSSLSENDVKTLIANGYNTENGTLSAVSPLQGDFVGGLVGFGDSVTISGCKTGSGYVLGNTFVGGVVGGLSTGTVLSDGTANGSHVFGHRYVGGVVSYNDSGSEITSMSNTGMTAAFGTKAAYAGGIVGYNAGKLTNCTAAASTNTATNTSRVQLLQAMANGYYADFVGGVAGYNAGTIQWTQTAAVSTLLNGGSFVGGVVGFNDAGAAITVADSAALTVSGRITGAQDAVGGLVGLNSGTTLPAVTVKAELISGRYCVGGALGANVVTTDMTATGLCTDGSGNRLQATALAGGIVGYNQVIAAMPTAENTITRAKLLLPAVTVDTNNILTVSEQNNKGTATVMLNGSTNALNLTADAYVGGVVGWGENLALNNAVNGAQNSVNKGVLHSSGSLQVTCAPNAEQTVTGNAAGGIIGYAGASATLDGCQNFAGVFHKQMAGGIAGYNAGTIQNCTQSANLGTRQTGYKYIGGIAGVNAGNIQASAPNNVTVSGEQAVGGVAGLNAQNGTIQAITNCTVTVQGSQAVGGVAGANQGTVQSSTLQTVNVAASGSNAGGAVGQNSGIVKNVAVTGGSVQGSQAVGGLAGDNGGSVEGCTTASTLTVRANQNAGAAVGSNESGAVVSAGNYAGTVYAASNNAGGIAGQNAGRVEGTATVSAKVTCENGNAGGVAALNSGSISAVQVQGCTVNSGSAYMGAVAAVNNGTIQGVTVKSAALQGGATVIGGIAGVNKGTIIGTNDSACTVQPNALTLSGLTAADITLGGAAGQNDATINNVQVALNVTDKLEKYRTLGGVAGENNGTLQNCVFTAGQLGETIAKDAPAKAGAAEVGDAIGGVAGVNNATVTGCTVKNISINVLGITNVESSQDVATKLDNASHVGGIVGRNSNKGTIQNSTIATDNGSAVIAKYGFVGGIAGSNAGVISGCGGQGTADAVSQIQTWLEAGKTDEMITQLKYSQRDDGASETDSVNTDFNKLRGVDAVRAGGYTNVYTDDGLTKNQLTVALRGSATISTEEAAGYLGGVTGYNTNTGVVSETATGKWFVYCDNGNVDNAVIGGMIGQNESDKDMTYLLNCAAVRRYSRTVDGDNGNDDTENKRTKVVDGRTISEQHVANANVGGVIGVQQNRSGDRWSLTNVVNYGTVHNSRSNNLAGIICLWVDNGGTLEHCFNFGTMRANSNGGGGSGTMGGIVALFDKPVAGGTTNLVSCQNHGDMLWENENIQKTANDVGGILGKIQMKNASDYLVVNITDCVNGSIKMQSNSLCVGVMAWLGPEGKIENAEVNIDRCRNYCLDATSVGGAGAAVGIYGNRGSGGDTRAATTITNCFTLYRNANARDNADCAILRPYDNGGSWVKENIQLDEKQPNLYMDKNSFAVSTARSILYATPYALETLKRGEVYKNDESYNDPESGRDRSNKTYFNSITPGYRLYAGKNTTDNTYFAALITGMDEGGGRTLEKIDGGNSYIQGNTIVNSADTNNKRADILFTFGESNKTDATQKYDSIRPDMSDITDTAVQAYYKKVLDEKFNMADATVTNIQAVRSDDTGNGTHIYGRYRVTWNPVTGASHYKVTVKVQEGDTYTEMPNILPTATVYTNQYTFEAHEDWAGKKYIVEVKPCNSQEGNPTSSDRGQPFTFAQTLPTPQIKLLSFDSGVDVILENVGDYEDVAGGWTLTVDCGGDKRDFTQDEVSKDGIKGKLFWLPNSSKNGTVSVRATVKANNPTAWMQSAQYNVMTYLPGNNYNGLGTLSIEKVAVTGTSTDNLAISADVKITGQAVNPKYRIMLQGKCKNSVTADNGTVLQQGQYITLQAVETVLSGSATRVTFSDLPDAALTDFTNLRILAAPVNTGMGDTTCRWEFRPGADDKHPVEYVRVEKDGTVQYEDYCFASLWHPENYPCTRTKDVTLTVVPAPTLNETATPTLVDNNLLYTFTWTNAENAADYTYKLYGVTAANNEVEINLPAGAAPLQKGKTQTTLTVKVDKLANGASDWHFTTVRLAVTSEPAAGSTNTVGATATREYTGIRTRLTKPGAPNSILLTNSADAETLPYKITWTGIADDALHHYELLAEYRDESGNWQPIAETWTTKDASLTVNLEKYQGKTLHLRVVAMPAADNSTVLQSPYSVTSNEFTVVERETAPTVSKVEFANTTPTQDEFLNKLQVEFTVNSGSSHYVTGYLFKEETDYKAVVGLVNAWKDADTNDKADALKALQEKLEKLLADNTQAVCLIPEGSRTTGLQAETKVETTGTTVQYTLSPEKFAMQPQYGGWYLLPAVRTMTTAENKACSVWAYCTTTELKVPCIRLDTPQAVRSESLYTGDATISDTPNAESGAATQVTVQRVAVEWSADNLYTAADGDTMLADTYEVKVTPTQGNGSPYTLRITVQPKDVYETDDNGETVKDDNGSPVVKTARGTVLSVEKTVDDENYFKLEANEDGGWYLDATQTTGEDGKPVLEPTTLTGTILQGGNMLRYYTMQVHPMLQYIADTKTYSLILPDLAAAVYADPNDTTGSQLTPYTAEVKITAKGVNGIAAVQASEAATIDPQKTN